VPQLGDEFPFFTAAGGVVGMFSNFNLPALGQGLAWEINSGVSSLSLSVVAVPEPGCLTILATLLVGLAPFGRQRALRR